MKTMTRIIAVLMTVAMLACLLAACGEKGEKDERVVGTWKQEDEIDGNWIWTFESNGTCKLVGETTGFESEGTYYIEAGGTGKMHINLDGWSEEKLFSYAVTTKAMDLEETYSSFHLFKQ